MLTRLQDRHRISNSNLGFYSSTVSTLPESNTKRKEGGFCSMCALDEAMNNKADSPCTAGTPCIPKQAFVKSPLSIRL